MSHIFFRESISTTYNIHTLELLMWCVDLLGGEEGWVKLILYDRNEMLLNLKNLLLIMIYVF